LGGRLGRADDSGCHGGKVTAVIDRLDRSIGHATLYVMKRAWITFRWMLVIAGLFGLFTEAKAEDAAKPLVIGMELNYPPFEMTDSSGNPSGVGVDMAHALGEYLHRPIQIDNMPFDGLIAALKTGRIDLIISSMTATDERRKSIDFSDPYLSTGLSILVKKDSPIKSIADIDKPGVTVVLKRGNLDLSVREKEPEYDARIA
jgi:ABC-type amino acid transport substrate-binding protein